jgi:hypothetical protein
LTSEIYNIDWYNASDLKICKFVLFWLTQAQIPVQMSGAGVVKVNRPVMLQVRFKKTIHSFVQRKYAANYIFRYSESDFLLQQR